MKDLSIYKELFNTTVTVSCTDGRDYTGEWTGWELPTAEDPVPENIILELANGDGLFALYAKEIESMAAAKIRTDASDISRDTPDTAACCSMDSSTDTSNMDTTGTMTTADGGSCCCRHTERSAKEVRDMISRLNRIEGQIRGIRGMIENDSYCIDILTQVSAASAALNGFSRVLMANHIKSCVANDIKEGREDKLDELLKFLPKMMK